MTPSLRPSLALLALALSLSACDPSVQPDDEFRSLSAPTQHDATLEFDVDLPPVRVTSYQLGGALEDAIDAGELDILLGGAGDPIDDAVLAVEFEGIAPVGAPGFGPGVIVLRNDGQAAEAPIAAHRFGISIDGVGIASSHAVLDAPGQVDASDYAVWQDNFGASPAPAEPVEAIIYTLVAADGTATTCMADIVPTEQLAFNYTKIEYPSASLEFDIADNCAEVLQAAAGKSPPDAFFVRCDRTTSSTVVGMHKFSNVTLKRGVLSATGLPVVEHLAG